jgi:hypothetical protein
MRPDEAEVNPPTMPGWSESLEPSFLGARARTGQSALESLPKILASRRLAAPNQVSGMNPRSCLR